jgi:hypothetical protein
VLGFAQTRAELFLGIKAFPSPAVLKVANMGKPPLREPMPFLRDLIETDNALQNRH